MKPMRLEMEAFGPYARRQILDFRELREHHLFLIYGPIGSGKSTILDGLCFALFGMTSGGERSGEEMRCRLASASAQCRCQLDFEIGEAQYRVERFPSKPDEDQIWALPQVGAPGDEHRLGRGRNGVSRAVEQVMGLGAAHFCQAAFLPQGKFRRFLLADAAEREDILARLLGAGKLERFRKRLQEECQRLSGELDAAWREREGLVSEEPDGEGSGDFYRRLEESQEALRSEEESIASLRRSEVSISRELERAVRSHGLSEEREEAHRQLRRLESRNDVDLRRRGQAEALLPLWEQLGRTRRRQLECQENLQVAREALASARDQKVGLGEQMEAARQLEEEKFELRELLERLDEAEKEFEELATLEAEMGRFLSGVAELQDQEAKLERLRDKYERRIDTIQAKLNRSFELESELTKVRTRLDDSQKRLERIEKYQQLETGLKKLQGQQERVLLREAELERRVERIREQAREAERLQLRQLAMRLSERLREGEACLVCGSTEHPEPATEASLEVEFGEEEQKRFETMLEKAEAMLRRYRRDKDEQLILIARMEERLDGLAEEIGSQEDYDRLVEEVGEESRRMDELELDLSERPGLRDKLEETEVKVDKVEARLERLVPKLRRAESQRDRLQGELDARRRHLLEEFESAEQLREQRELTEQRLRELEEVVFDDEAARVVAEAFADQMAQTRAQELQLEQAMLESHQAFETFNKAILAEGIRDEYEYEAILEAAEGTQARDELVALEARLADARERLEKAEQNLGGEEASVDLDSLRHQRDVRRRKLEHHIERKGRLESEIADLSEKVDRYHELVGRIQELEPRAVTSRRFHDLVEGRNRKELTFRSFVLSRWLTQILHRANRRLQLLTRGRYRLVQSEPLFLQVFDRRSGDCRGVSTLSGGESFLASLALALGLSDAVCRRQNGILKTLFIDEGFGNLDPEALDLCMKSLAELQDEDRLVGIISHFEGLKDRLGACLAVQPGPRGSTVTLELD